MSVAKLVNEFIKKLPTGEPFVNADLLKFGSRANVDQILSRLVRTKTITRVARGVFVKQETIPYVGSVLPEPSKVVAAVARISGETVAIHGAEAARQLQLTTQMPTKSVFLTTGTTRRIKIGNAEICLKHVAPSKIANSNNICGLVISALWYLGKKHVNECIINQIKNKLTGKQFRQLQSCMGSMPGWMVNAFHHYNRVHANAR